MKIIKNSVLYLISLALTTSCSLSYPINQNSNLGANFSQNTVVKTTISGSVEFPTTEKQAYSIKATVADIGINATVSLIYPPDHPTFPYKTIATGLSDGAGVFSINPDASFNPAVGSMYILQSSKRIGGTGNSLMTVTTYLRWTLAGWESITFPNIVISSKTTALSVIADKLKVDIPTENIINKINVTGGGSVVTSLFSNKITFSSDRDGNKEIYKMFLDGTSQSRLITNTSIDETAVWSPDERKVAFVSQRDNNQEIYVMNADGTNQVRITNNSVSDFNPTWSPDGLKIAFAGNRVVNSVPNTDVYIINADGTGETRVTTNSGIDDNPMWSPDGTKLSFVSQRDGNKEIYVINTNGSSEARFTSNSAEDSEPVWSPDGTKIAFSSDRTNNKEVFTMSSVDSNSDGNGDTPTNITNNAAKDTYPSWSADGAKIIFETNRDGNDNIYSIDVNGSNSAMLTSNTGSDTQPHISSHYLFTPALVDSVAEKVKDILRHGYDPYKYISIQNQQFVITNPVNIPQYVGQIIFESNSDGDMELYLMSDVDSDRVNPGDVLGPDGNGDNLIKVTNDNDNTQPVFSPDLSKIAFVDGGDEISSISPDGTNKLGLTGNAGFSNIFPTWTNDNTKIFFASDRNFSDFHIWWMNADGSTETKITDVAFDDTWPDVSPNGTKVIFQRDLGTNSDIFIMNPDGTSQTNLTNTVAINERHPSWSPDGTKITFEGNNDIYVMNANGTNIVQLTSAPNNAVPSWSTVGDKIVFVSTRDGNKEIYIMNPDGTNQTRMTNNSFDDDIPRWVN